MRRTVSTSLSPRPERLTSTTAPAAASGRCRRTQATACADSSAGRMPSRSRQPLEARERLVVVDPGVLRAAARREPGVLGPDRRIVEPGRHRMRRQDVAVRRPAARRLRVPCSTPAAAAGKPRRVIAGLDARGRRLRRRRAAPSRRRRTRRRCPSRCCRRRRTRRRDRAAVPRPPESAAAPPARSPTETRAPSADTDAVRAPIRAGSRSTRRSRPSRASPR